MVDASSLVIPCFHDVLGDVMAHGHTHYWLHGGRGSTKSSFISVCIVLLLLAHPEANAVVVRRFSNTLRDSVFSQMTWAIAALELDAWFRARIKALLSILRHVGVCDAGAFFTLPIRTIDGGVGMDANGLDEYWVPEHVKDYLRKLGFVLPLDDMEPWIRSWDDWMSARGDFYDYRDKDGVGRVYEVHRRSIHPRMALGPMWGRSQRRSTTWTS